MVCAVQFLQGMSEKIKQGIEAAQTDLVKEKALKEQEEVRKGCGLPLRLSMCPD